MMHAIDAAAEDRCADEVRETLHDRIGSVSGLVMHGQRVQFVFLGFFVKGFDKRERVTQRRQRIVLRGLGYLWSPVIGSESAACKNKSECDEQRRLRTNRCARERQGH